MENQAQRKSDKCKRGVGYKDCRGEVKGKVYLAGRFKYLRKALQDEDAGYHVCDTAVSNDAHEDCDIYRQAEQDDANPCARVVQVACHENNINGLKQRDH